MATHRYTGKPADRGGLNDSTVFFYGGLAYLSVNPFSISSTYYNGGLGWYSKTIGKCVVCYSISPILGLVSTVLCVIWGTWRGLIFFPSHIHDCDYNYLCTLGHTARGCGKLGPTHEPNSITFRLNPPLEFELPHADEIPCGGWHINQAGRCWKWMFLWGLLGGFC